jgi:signal transduction histidine kinase
MIGLSVALTALTLWAVARQGQALAAREFADLRNAATEAVTQRHAALLADVQRTFDLAARAWEHGGADELDAWVAGGTEELLLCVQTGDGLWEAFPRTPLERSLPSSQPATSPAGESADLMTMLREFQQSATNADPLTRAGALLAMAAVEQQLGHPLAAARIFADAAQLLRSTPQLAGYAFRAELSRIDSLIAAGDHERARQALEAFVRGLAANSAALLGEMELGRLEQDAAALNVGSKEALGSTLDELRHRARGRAELLAAARQTLATHDARGGAAERAQFLRGQVTVADPLVLAVRTLPENTRIALVWPAAAVLTRYWRPGSETVPWQARLPGPESGPTLVRLGPEFGGAVLEPTPARAAELRVTARRQTTAVVATAIGMAGAWVLVIWMMTRVVARQRELAQLQGRFVADVSHELKTPLALIRLCAETLAERRVTDPERVTSYHETIVRESERLSLLLDNILDLGRIESGRKVFAFSECDVVAVAQQAWTLFEPRFAQEGFETHLDLGPDLPTIRADAAALQQVLVNLLQNAHRYAGDGKYVRLAVWREGYVILLRVEDHGIGMNRGELDRLGESFFRADDTRVRQTRGVGLGLAIANHIVAAHGGKLEVQSRPGQGSTFTVWIPFEKP